MDDRFFRVLDLQRIAFERLSDRDYDAVMQRWRETFACGTKVQAGSWTYRGYDWHTFSWNYAIAKHGAKAVHMYQQQASEDFYVLLDAFQGDHGVRCMQTSMPDFVDMHLDLYIFPSDLTWTMVHTHEEPQLGPYFARAEWQA